MTDLNYVSGVNTYIIDTVEDNHKKTNKKTDVWTVYYHWVYDNITG